MKFIISQFDGKKKPQKNPKLHKILQLHQSACVYNQK